MCILSPTEEIISESAQRNLEIEFVRCSWRVASRDFFFTMQAREQTERDTDDRGRGSYAELILSISNDIRYVPRDDLTADLVEWRSQSQISSTTRERFEFHNRVYHRAHSEHSVGRVAAPTRGLNTTRSARALGKVAVFFPLFFFLEVFDQREVKTGIGRASELDNPIPALRSRRLTLSCVNQ